MTDSTPQGASEAEGERNFSNGLAESYRAEVNTLRAQLAAADERLAELRNEVDFQKTVCASQGEMIGKLHKELLALRANWDLLSRDNATAIESRPDVMHWQAAYYRTLDKLDGAQEQLAAAESEAKRLKRGDFTPSEFQALCHHRDERPGCTAEDFFAGCAEYQRKLFGRSAALLAAADAAEREGAT